MPPNTVYVGRPTKWGNQFKVGEDGTAEECLRKYSLLIRQTAFVDVFRLVELRGKDLACWCKPGNPCHADVLLELANRLVNHV